MEIAPVAARKHPEQASVPELMYSIADDAQTLIRQQLELLRADLRQEMRTVRQAAVAAGAGAGLVAVGGILTGHMIVHGWHKLSGWPLWACYGAVGGALAAGGAALMRRAAGVPWVPPETASALRENLTWIKKQTDPTPR
jgi:hypothetical protein